MKDVGKQLLSRRSASILALLFFSLLGSGCSKKLEALQNEVNEIKKALNDVSDVGVISELGWLSKLLRDSAQGTPAEQDRARQAIARLFSIDPSALSNQQFFEVTVQLTGFELGADQALHVDAKYFTQIYPDEIRDEFAAAPGNAWQPQSVRDPMLFQRTAAEMRALVRSRLNELVGKPSCRETDYGKGGSCSFTLDTADGVSWSPYPGRHVGMGNAIQKREEFLDRWTAVFMAPMEVNGLPPSGSVNGQLTYSWGLTGGAMPYIAIFVPQKEVALHTGLKISAWLHLKGMPQKILGKGYQLEAVDFTKRCTGSVEYKNPTPPVDSKSTYGPLCWYAFDLFGSGTRSRLSELVREATLQNPAK